MAPFVTRDRAIPDLISGEVWIDEDGNVYLLDQIDDGQGQVVERETFLMQVTRVPSLILRPIVWYP
jgi:hypothetical protein